MSASYPIITIDLNWRCSDCSLSLRKDKCPIELENDKLLKFSHPGLYILRSERYEDRLPCFLFQPKDAGTAVERVSYETLRTE